MDIFDRLRSECAADWSSYVDHAFVRQLGDATLPEAAFRTYLVQDYLFLIQFARAYALAIYKSRTLADMRSAHAGVAAILDVEMDLHVRLCGRWGLTPGQLEAAPELQATVAYTRYVLDCGLSGDLLAGRVNHVELGSAGRVLKFAVDQHPLVASQYAGIALQARHLASFTN